MCGFKAFGQTATNKLRTSSSQDGLVLPLRRPPGLQPTHSGVPLNPHMLSRLEVRRVEFVTT